MKYIILVILILLLIAYFMIGNYFYNLALNPNTSKTFVLGEPIEKSDYMLQQEEWLETNSKDVYLTSTNNGKLKLHAYELENEVKTDIWTIVVHGYTGEGKDMLGVTKQFLNMGYNVLVIDLRGHGQSEGNYIGMGWHDRLDLIDWANYIINKNKDSRIILYGVSMGAATVMMATGEQLPSNIKVAIEDCGYSSIWSEFQGQLKTLFGLETFPVLNAASTVCRIRAGYGIKEGSSVEQVKKSTTPTLFIHGSEDKFVPFGMLDVVYKSANCEKEKLVIEGAEHANSSAVNPELYWNTVKSFINKYL